VPILCFERHEIIEALIKFLTKIPFKSCILKTLNICFGKFIVCWWHSSLFDRFVVTFPNIVAPQPQGIVLIVS